MTPVDPTLDIERAQLRAAPVVIGMDEVGRGALAGPVVVGVSAVRAEEIEIGFPEGLRDSKLLTERRREALAPLADAWVWASATGWASADEIDQFGIGPSLAAAGVRALASLWEQGVPVDAATIVLDGTHDWLTPGCSAPLHVVTQPKADRDCASVAAASVIAKVARDRHMVELVETHPKWAPYGWERNKGYGSAQHREAIAELGACPEHRASWLHKILAGASR
ncbi:ribonuclease HII [Gulosibacter bifidus]|uniref:Ribonuclease n=1 Tax=Gulosibacter bifidus TaxID=272239 RepID=A0ABW5RI72_9MICO|nr:ribonuclease HII [Gulosibacter bifidus]